MAQSWSRVERIIARVEAGAEGPDTRFVVTNLSKRNARRLYEDVYVEALDRDTWSIGQALPQWRGDARSSP